MADSAADVPTKYDVLIDGHGYIFADDTDSPYFSRHSTYTFTPTFLERTNISGNYGDNNQAFYMTLTQHNWSEGEGQRFVDLSNPDSLSKSWKIAGGDPRNLPGQVSPAPGLDTGTLGFVASTSNAIVGMAAAPTANAPGVGLSKNIYMGLQNGHMIQWSTKTNTYFDMGLKGGGGFIPSGILVLGGEVANSGTGLGYSEKVLWETKIWTPSGTTGAWSTFLDATPGRMCLLNNLIYGFDGATFRQFNSSGVSTVLYQFKDGFGNVLSANSVHGGDVIGAGGRVYFLSSARADTFSSELWSYDGNAAHIELRLPNNTTAYNLCESQGILFLGGYTIDEPNKQISSLPYSMLWPTVWAYDGSNFSVSWKSTIPLITYHNERTNDYCAAVASYKNGIVIASPTDNALFYLDVNGVLNTLGTRDFALVSGFSLPPIYMVATEGSVFACTTGSNAASSPFASFPNTLLSTATVDSSLFDGGSSLQKYWKSVSVDFDHDQGSDQVDIYYQLGSVDGAYTLLQSNAASGTEYPIQQTSTSISIRVVLTPQSATDIRTPSTPRLKRILLRGVPLLDTYRRASYLLDCSGNKMSDPPMRVNCRNGQPHPLDGDEQRVNLQATIAKKTPVTIVDRFGTYSGIIEPDQSTFEEVRQDYGRGEYKATIVCREV